MVRFHSARPLASSASLCDRPASEGPHYRGPRPTAAGPGPAELRATETASGRSRVNYSALRISRQHTNAACRLKSVSVAEIMEREWVPFH